MIGLFDVGWVDPLADADLIERLSELAVIIALFGTGLKLDRPLDWASWSGVARLLGIAMPLTIAGVVLFGAGVMGLSLGAAIVLGAILAPTDPVLAGDIGVGPPGDEDEHEPNFSVTGEAGLNDGLALPVPLPRPVRARPRAARTGSASGSPPTSSTRSASRSRSAPWSATASAALAVRLRDRRLLASAFDSWLAIPSVLAIYGLTEIAGAYGFVAAFVGGVAFRRYEHTHEHNLAIHDGAEVVEKFGELIVILVLGSMLSFGGLGAPGLSGWLLVPVLLLLIRPISVAAALIRSDMPAGERAFVAWFGVRGIGSLYYAAVAVGAGVLSAADAELVVWTAIACVIVSIVVHGVTAAPLSRRWLPPEARD